MKTLTIILATRGRPGTLASTLARTAPNLVVPTTNFVLAIDDDDKETREAYEAVGAKNLIVSCLPREDSVGAKYNRALKVAPADVYCVMVDYVPILTKGFDKLILEAADRFHDGIGCVYGPLANLSFPSIQAPTAKLCELMGNQIYVEHFPYWFIDHWLDDLVRMTGRFAFVDLQSDQVKKHPTQEMRDPDFWATFYDGTEALRDEMAERILNAIDMLPEERQRLISNFPYVHQRSRMINHYVKQMQASAGAPDARYLRMRAKAQMTLTNLVKRLEADMGTVVAPPGFLDHPFAQQNPEEFKWLLEKIKGATSILEVGSCFGHSLRMMAQVAAPGARIRAIDLGEGQAYLKGVNTGSKLQQTVEELRGQGFDAQAIFGNSHDPQVIARARESGPYDFVFIDAGHDLADVKADWMNYGVLAKTCAFHDIAHPDHDVSKFWNMLKDFGWPTDECIRSGMGIGIVDVKGYLSGQSAVGTQAA